VIRQLAEQLAETCVRREATHDGNHEADQATIECAKLSGVSRHVVREMFVALWRDLNWPRQDMGFAEWDALADMAQQQRASIAARIFPGEVAATRSADRMQLKRRREQ
jgi:hypothetical protein